jgi:hypothetical protein
VTVTVIFHEPGSAFSAPANVDGAVANTAAPINVTARVFRMSGRV